MIKNDDDGMSTSIIALTCLKIINSDNKINLCMPKKVSKEPTEQTEAKAISNLLEIALKPHEDSSNWEDKRANVQLHNQNRTYSFFRITQGHEQHRAAKNILKHGNLSNSSEKPNNNDLASSLKDPFSSRNEAAQSGISNEKPHWIQGDYWSSRVNWMPESSNNQLPSQLRLHKKRSTGFQNHGKAARERSNRYQNPEATFSRQWKSNLAFSLNKEKFAARNKQDEKNKNQRGINQTYDSLNGLNNNIRFKISIQDYVRETFDKIYEKNHEQNAYSPYKQSEQQKSTIVRKLLHNLQSIKDQNPKVNNRLRKYSYKQRVRDSYIKETSEVVDDPQPYPLRSQRKKDQHSILNLNEEAEKVYQSRSINQFGRKNSSLRKIQ